MISRNIVLLATILLITACAPSQPPAKPTMPLQEPTPTFTATPVPPSPVPTATENIEPINFDLELIKMENAANIVPIANWKNVKRVSAINFSQDGQYLIVGLTTGDIKMWNLSDGNLIATFSGHKKEVLDVETSSDGKYVVSSSDDTTVRLWDAATGELLKTLEGHSGKVLDVDFSPDGTQIASASLDKTVRIWKSEDGSLIHELTDHTDGVSTVAYLSDGSTLATAAKDKTTRIWNTENGRLINTLDFSKISTEDFNLAAIFTPNGQQLAVRNSFNSSISIFNIDGYELEKKITPPGMLNNTLFMFSPDGSLLITGSQHSGMNVIDFETGNNLIELVHQGGVRDITMAPNGKIIASIDRNLYLYVWGVKP